VRARARRRLVPGATELRDDERHARTLDQLHAVAGRRRRLKETGEEMRDA
jgi:hypothetical protein